MRNWTLKFGGEHRVYLSNYTDAEESVYIQTDGGYTRELINATGGGVGTVTVILPGGPQHLFCWGREIYMWPRAGASSLRSLKNILDYMPRTTGGRRRA